MQNLEGQGREGGEILAETSRKTNKEIYRETSRESDIDGEKRRRFNERLGWYQMMGREMSEGRSSGLNRRMGSGLERGRGGEMGGVDRERDGVGRGSGGGIVDGILEMVKGLSGMVAGSIDGYSSEDDGPVPTSLIRRNNILVSPQVIKEYNRNHTPHSNKHNGQ